MYINDGLDTVEVENVTHETDILLEKADEVRKAMVAAMKAKDKERKEKHEKNKNVSGAKNIYCI